MIEVKNLRKSFGESVVLNGVSFSAEKGKIVSLVGANGCGKTTILRIIGGAINDFGGDIFVDGQRSDRSALKIGYIPQGLGLMPWLTAYENVAFPLNLSSAGPLTNEQKKLTVENSLKAVDMWDQKDRFIAKLSGGERQKLAIARELTVIPDILLMDEPFASIDAINRNRFRRDLIRVWEKTKPTIIFVTHDHQEAVWLSSRVFVLSPRPATALAAVEVPYEYPRAPIEEDTRLLALASKIRSLLETE